MGILTTLLQLIAISVSPILELRGSIPYGILVTNLPWFVVFAVCTVANFLIAPVIYIFLDKFVHLLFFIGWFETMYKKYVEKTQRKAQKNLQKRCNVLCGNQAKTCPTRNTGQSNIVGRVCARKNN